MKFEYFQNGMYYYLEMPDYLKSRTNFDATMMFIYKFETQEDFRSYFEKEFNAKTSVMNTKGSLPWVLISFPTLEDVRLAAKTLNKQIKKYSLAKLKEGLGWK